MDKDLHHVVFDHQPDLQQPPLRQIDGQFAPALASGIEDAELVVLQKDPAKRIEADSHVTRAFRQREREFSD